MRVGEVFETGLEAAALPGESTTLFADGSRFRLDVHRRSLITKDSSSQGNIITRRIKAPAGANAGAAVGSAVGGMHIAAVGGFAGGVIGGIAGKVTAKFAKEAYLRKLCKRYRKRVTVASITYQSAERNRRVEFIQFSRRLDGALARTRSAYAKDYLKGQRARENAVQACKQQMLGAARRARAVGADGLRLAIEDLRNGDNAAFVSIVGEAQRSGDARLANALGLYIALHQQFEGVLVENVAAYDKITREFDAAGKAKAASVLEDLARRAKDLFGECESLRDEIEKELRKLGKPLPALPSHANQ